MAPGQARIASFLLACAFLRLLLGPVSVFPRVVYFSGVLQNLHLSSILPLLVAASELGFLTRTQGGVLCLLAAGLTPLCWNSWKSAVGLASLLLLTFWMFRLQGAARSKAQAYLGLAAFFWVFPALIQPLMQFVSRTTPEVYDLQAYRLDGMFGFQPAFAVLGFVHSQPALNRLLVEVYEAIPLVYVGAMALALRRPKACHFDVFPAIALGTAAGVCLYALYPASGTRFLCETFQLDYPPSRLPVLTHTDPIPCGPEWWRNCVPSLHTVWAVVCYFALSRQGYGLRAFSLFFMGLTLVATLSRGEHYLGDLVSSFPLSLSLVAIFGNPGRVKKRGYCALAGLIGGLGWILLVRFAPHILWDHPLATGTLVLVMVSATFAAEAWLAADYFRKSSCCRPDSDSGSAVA